MALKDFPEVHAAFNKLMAEKEALVAQVKPLREQYDALQAQVDALRAKQKALGVKIHAIERPALIEIDTKLSVMARAAGGKSLSGG